MSAPEWIASLGDRDPSVPIALAAITRAAGATDTVDFGDLVMSYREAHIACHRPLDGPVQVEITGDEVRDHLTELLAAFTEVADSPEDRVLVITGAGGGDATRLLSRPARSAGRAARPGP